MTEPSERVIWIDADGNLSGKDQAVRGEILETLPDGTIQSTLFTVRRDTEEATP